jgi:hypothetical protein
MANKRRGQLTVTGQWARHLRPLLHRAFWKQERQAGRALVAAEAMGRCEEPAPPPVDATTDDNPRGDVGDRIDAERPRRPTDRAPR